MADQSHDEGSADLLSSTDSPRGPRQAPDATDDSAGAASQSPKTKSSAAKSTGSRTGAAKSSSRTPRRRTKSAPATAAGEAQPVAAAADDLQAALVADAAETTAVEPLVQSAPQPTDEPASQIVPAPESVDDDLPRPPSGRRSKTRPAGPPAERASSPAVSAAAEASDDESSSAASPSAVSSDSTAQAGQDEQPKTATRRRSTRKPAAAQVDDPGEDAASSTNPADRADTETSHEVSPRSSRSSRGRRPEQTASPAESADETQATDTSDDGQPTEDSVSAAINAVEKRTRNRSGQRQAAEQLLGEVPTDENGEVDKQAALQSLAAALAGGAAGERADSSEAETENDAQTAEQADFEDQPAAADAEQGDEQDDDGGDQGADGEASPTAPKRRRRRGGRRRRRSGGSGDANAQQSSDDEDDEESAEQSSDDAQDSEESSTESDSNSEANADNSEASDQTDDSEAPSDGVRRRRRRRRGGEGPDDPDVVVQVREPRPRATVNDEVTGIEGSTRLEAKRQRRKEGRAAGRHRAPILTEAEFLARRESVDRKMIVRQSADYTQIAVLEDDILVEHYVDRDSSASAIGNVYLGKVQNVLPSMEAVFIDIGRGRNAVLYAGEVNWDAFEVADDHRKVEEVFKSGQSVIVQVSKDSVGAKGARLTGHISIPGRFVVYSPDGHLSGISRKLPDVERARLKRVLDEVVGDDSSVIVRTAAEGASEDELVKDVERLKAHWQVIERKAKQGGAPVQLYTEPDLTLRTIRDVFTEDFNELIVAGIPGADDVFDNIDQYVQTVAPSLHERLTRWDVEAQGDPFEKYRIDEQISKALERKVFLPSGGSLVIDRTEAMTVIDVNTGKFTGTGGNLEETVTRNNLEAAEEIVRQLRLRDLGGIVVIDFIDMVLPANRELLLRRLVECLGRDRTRHQVSEVTSLGLVQLTRKRIGTGLAEAFTEECQTCGGRGFIRHEHPVATQAPADGGERGQGRKEAERKPRANSSTKTSGSGSTRKSGTRKASAKKDAEPKPATDSAESSA